MKKFLSLMLLILTFSAYSQTIEFVVSATAGGPQDNITRKVADIIQKELNIKYVVINKPGASHYIAYNFLFESKKPSIIISTSEIKKHELIAHVDNVFEIGKFQMYLFSGKKLNIKSIDQLVEISTKREIVFGSSPVHTFSYRGMEHICKILVQCLSILYKSSNDGILGLLRDEVDVVSTVSFGTNVYLENKNLTLIHTFNIDNNELILYSKNIDETVKKQIKNVLKERIDENFRKSYGLIK